MQPSCSGARHRVYPFGGAVRFYTALLILLLVGLVGTACDDPVDGAIGGVVFLVRGVPTEPGSRFAEVSSVTLAYDRVEGIVEGGAPVLLDSQQRSIKVSNAASDTFVAQFQVPVGSLEQIRFFPTAVTLQLSTGDAVELDPETSDLPSWRNSGWKVVPVEDEPFEVREDQLTGVAALLEFATDSWREVALTAG